MYPGSILAWRPELVSDRQGLLVLLLCALGFTSCRASHCPPIQERFQIEVEAPSEDLRLEVATAAARVVPELEEEFGVRSGLLKIVVDSTSSDGGLGGFTTSKGITLYPRAIPWITGALAHEAVHWLTHWKVSCWNTLPIAVEEGFAQLAFHKYSSTEIPVSSFGSDEIAHALQLSHEEYNALPDKRAATYAGGVPWHPKAGEGSGATEWRAFARVSPARVVS